MKLKRLKRSSKAPSWKKGQSSLDNPRQTKFRDAANLRMMPKLPQGENPLTKEALISHDKALEEVSRDLITLKVDPDDYQSKASTFKTFATNFTTCTLPAFDKFFEESSKDSPLHKKMLSILAATEEKVKEKFSESDASYLFYLMEALKGVEDSEEDTLAAISLISRVITKTGPGFLNAKFPDYSKLFENIFTRYETSQSSSKFISCLMGCISTLLRAVSIDHWDNTYTLNLLKKILDYITHSDKKLRKQAQYNVTAVLKGSHFMPGAKRHANSMESDAPVPFRLHPAANSVAKFAAMGLKSARLSINALTALHLIEFLKISLPTFSAKSHQTILDEMVATMNVADERLNAASFRTINALVTYEDNTDVSETLLLKIYSELTNVNASFIPKIHDAKQCKIWMQPISATVIKVCKVNLTVGLSKLCSWISLIVPYWKSDTEAAHIQVSDSIELLLESCIKPLGKNMASHCEEVTYIVKTIATGTSLQYSAAWSSVFRSLGKCFETIGPVMSHMMTQHLKEFIYLQTTIDAKHRLSLDYMFGAAIRALGPELVLEAIPFSITGDIIRDEKLFWILPLLRMNIKKANLMTFQTYFVDHAVKCSDIIKVMIDSGDGESIVTKSYRTIRSQIWSLLPAFAKSASDIDEVMANKMFAQLLGVSISEDPDIRVDIMAGVRHLVENCNNSTSPMVEYAKNFIPIFLKMYRTKPHNDKSLKQGETSINPGHRFAASDTMKVYLTITPNDLIVYYYDKLLLDYDKNENSDYFAQKSDFHLLKLFLPYLEHGHMIKLWEKIKTVICKKKETTKQKASYRALTEMANIPQCKSFIEDQFMNIFAVMIEAQSHTASNAIGARLHCLTCLLSHLPKFLEAAGPGEQHGISIYKGFWLEALNFCGRNSSSPVRNAAMGLFKKIVDAAREKTQENSENAIGTICLNTLACVGTNPVASSNAIIALAFCVYEFQKNIDKTLIDQLMNTIVPCLKSTRVEAKSTLDFVRLMFGLFPVPVMSDYVQLTMDCLVEMDSTCRSAFRLVVKYLLCSLLRKFGADRIKGLVPEHDVVLKKVLSNLIKAEELKKRTQKTKQEKKKDKGLLETSNVASLEDILDRIVDEIEGDPDTIEDSKPKSILKKGIYINEGEDDIVDFLDPTAIQSISTKEPKKVQIVTPNKAQKNFGFRTDDQTGKFIIEDSDSEEERAPKKKKGKLGEIQQILDDDEEETKRTVLGKRKRSERLDYDENDDDDWDDDSSEDTSDEEAPQVSEKQVMKKQKTAYGAEFKAKKAQGDVKKKQGPAPYAYVPFNKSSLNKRKRAKSEGQFKNLVKGCQKGAKKGNRGKTLKRL